MSLPRWSAGVALFGAVAFAGCEETPAEKVQSDREEVVHDQQELRKDRAELNQDKRDAAREAAAKGPPDSEGGPLLPPLPAPDSAPTEGSQATSPGPGGPDARLVDAPMPVEKFPVGREPADAPNEGAPEASTPAAGTGERPAGAPPLKPLSGSDGQ